MFCSNPGAGLQAPGACRTRSVAFKSTKGCSKTHRCIAADHSLHITSAEKHQPYDTHSNTANDCSASDESANLGSVNRRSALAAWASILIFPQFPLFANAADDLDIQIGAAPDQSTYDPQDTQLREAAALLQQGLNATDVKTEEAIWTEIIDRYSDVKAPWVPDVVGRAWGNRGNARSRQGKLEAALSDYNQSMRICPWSVDPVLNRGVALEALGRFEEAIVDYRAVLKVADRDPAAWNNLGNAHAGLGRWEEAAQYYGRATQLAPAFSFAAANRALAIYQLGRDEEAIREMRSLLRRYPDFPDMRAALAAALWAAGKEGDAENNWGRVEDPRYRDRAWLKSQRRWPPRLIAALEALLDVRSLA